MDGIQSKGTATWIVIIWRNVGIGGSSQVNRLKSNASANTSSTHIAVSSSNGGLGLPTGDLVGTAVCEVGVAAGKVSSG